MRALDPFYLIVGDADLLDRLVPLGVRLVQLRIKDRSPADIRAQIMRAQATCAAHGAQLVVNDYWEIALELGCDFVHLGQEDMDSADFDALRRAGMRFGLSTHDEAELDHALALSPAYVALGPVYPTLLKQMKWGAQGLDRVRQWKARAGKVPLVGIGGLVPERLPGLFAAGADCAAVVTDIAQATDPEARCREWIAATRCAA
ncbi:thiamine phosphate synthase [Actibacterium sp. XHP0104]|uniref:thiamine phosphate synthase n=1 Tax=Actibacterium sp. XHP0104 TaxID=2984335 RepID=UPI0021E81D95|nr:thiamine phosphate synthase [Actibacterium sp. XHP0104]MCV2880416.1 thiamine phosphate synthase [Actibacterium sp. XHP0104]